MFLRLPVFALVLAMAAPAFTAPRPTPAPIPGTHRPHVPIHPHPPFATE